MLKFFKPNLWKIILTMMLFFVSSALWGAYVMSRITDTFPSGFPFRYYLAWGPCPPGEICSEFNRFYLILDIVIWYVISALIVDLIRRRRA